MSDAKFNSDLDCEAARAEIGLFLGSRNVGAKSPALRAHLARCVECNTHYRELVVGVARIASGARQAAEVRYDDNRESLARRSLIGAETRHRLRLPKSILPLAVIALIAALVMKSGTNSVTLRATEGTVYRGPDRVVLGERVPAANGDGCSTAVDGRAELARGDDRIEIEPDSSFTIERLDRLAMRLFDGAARVEGAGLIVFPTGALEVTAGAARIRVDDVAITVEALRGQVEFTDASGRVVIPPGTTRVIEHPHVTAQR